MFGNLIEFSICLTFFFHIKSLGVQYNTKDMPEAVFVTVEAGGRGRRLALGTHYGLKQQRWRRLRKRHLKSEFMLLQTLSSKGMCQSSGKKKKVVVL